MVFIDSEALRHMSGNCLTVAGKHDGSFHTDPVKRTDRIGGVRLFHIGNDNVSGIGAVHGNMDNGARTAAGLPGHIQPLHELCVADGDSMTVYLSRDAVTADLLNIRH